MIYEFCYLDFCVYFFGSKFLFTDGKVRRGCRCSPDFVD